VWVEPRRLVVRRRTLQLPGWPPELAGLRVGVASDFHAGAPHVDANRVAGVAARLEREAPALVVLLGDFVDPAVAFGGRVAPEAVADALGALHPAHGTYAVLGNHDWAHAGRRVAGALRRAGITVLEDEAVAVPGTDGRLWLAGLGDLRTRGVDMAAALAEVPADAAVLLLSHDPDVFPQVPGRVALTLAGHTHGGQVNLPLVRRLVIPSGHGLRYRGGHVVEGGRHLLVTSGVGTSGWPLRALAPPEVVSLRLEPARAG
jgi:predicted MPP superfamily phosphohydrolase